MNMQAMLKQAQALQKDMMKVKNEIDNTEFVGESSMAKVTLKGNHEAVKVELNIDGSLEDDDKELLEDSIVLAINDVKIDNTVNIDVINMITSIKEATAEDETENVLENAALTVGNETLNEVESEGGISNSVQSTLSNDNENVQATGNTANSRNSVRETTPTSANTVSSSNSTTSTSTGSLSSMVQQ